MSSGIDTGLCWNSNSNTLDLPSRIINIIVETPLSITIVAHRTYCLISFYIFQHCPACYQYVETSIFEETIMSMSGDSMDGEDYIYYRSTFTLREQVRFIDR